MRDDEAENGPMSVFRRAKERQPEISERVVPVIAVLAKISPGIAELMRGVNLRYGLRGAESLEAAQAQFVPKDFLPSSSYTKRTKGMYATGCAVSTEVSVAAAAQVEEEATADDAAARAGAKPKHLRFTSSVKKAAEGAAQFLAFPYSGIGTQGNSSINKRFWGKFTDHSFIGKWFRTCASIARGKKGGVSAHMRIFNYAAVTKPIIDEMFLRAGERAGYNTTLEMDHDIEALFGGAFLGGRLDDGGLNAGDLGSLVLGEGFDGRGLGPRAYAILDTAAVLEQIEKEKVEERPAVAVFEDFSGGINALGDLHQLMVTKKTTVNVLAKRDANKRGDTVPALEKITAGEFARWLNSAGGRASAAERKRLRETDDSRLTPMEKGKRRRMDGFGGNPQAHSKALAAGGVPVAGRDVDPEKTAEWRRNQQDGLAAAGVPIAGRDVDPEAGRRWREANGGGIARRYAAKADERAAAKAALDAALAGERAAAKAARDAALEGERAAAKAALDAAKATRDAEKAVLDAALADDRAAAKAALDAVKAARDAEKAARDDERAAACEASAAARAFFAAREASAAEKEAASATLAALAAAKATRDAKEAARDDERRAASRALAEARTAKANERAAAKAAKRAVAPTEGLV